MLSPNYTKHKMENDFPSTKNGATKHNASLDNTEIPDSGIKKPYKYKTLSPQDSVTSRERISVELFREIFFSKSKEANTAFLKDIKEGIKNDVTTDLTTLRERLSKLKSAKKTDLIIEARSLSMERYCGYNLLVREIELREELASLDTSNEETEFAIHLNERLAHEEVEMHTEILVDTFECQYGQLPDF